MSYSPTQCGAQCNICPFQGRKVVAPVLGRGDTLVIGDYPGEGEVKSGIPFSPDSPAGSVLHRTLSANGIPTFSKTNAILCKPYKSELEELEDSLSKMNEVRKENNLPLMIHPILACKPRLDREIRDYPNRLLLGSYALYAYLGKRRKTKDLIGYPVDRTSTFLLPNPAQGLRHPAWGKVFEHGVSRFARLSRGEKRTGVTIIENPTMLDMLEFKKHYQRTKMVGADSETDGRNALSCKLRTLQFAVRTGPSTITALVFWYRNKDGTPIERPEYERQFVIELLTDGSVTKAGLNWVYFDTQVLETNGLPTPVNNLECMTLHNFTFAAERMPHSLSFMAQQYTLTEAWKNEDKGWDTTNHDNFVKYGGTDAANTLEVAEALLKDALSRGLTTLPLQQTVSAPTFARHMHRNGIRLDVDLWAELRKTVRDMKEEARKDLVNMVGRGFNPASTKQLYTALTALGFHSEKKTKGGAPSVDVDSMRKAIISPVSSPELKAFCRRLRTFKKCGQTEGMLNSLDPKGKVLYPDYRARPAFNAAGTICTRYSSGGATGPNMDGSLNMQNQSGHERWSLSNGRVVTVKNMWIPDEGCIFVKSDLKGSHLRLMAAFDGWRIPRLIRMIETGTSGHMELAAIMYGDLVTKHREWLPGVYAPVKPKGSQVELGKIYDAAKVTQFNGGYGGGPKTVLSSMLKSEQADGTPVHEKATLASVTLAMQIWFAKEPEFPRAWAYEEALFKKKGFAECKLSGARAYFGRSEDSILNAIANWPFIRGEAHAMHEIERVLMRMFPATYFKIQEHDSFLLCCPIEKAEETAKGLDDSMRWTHPKLNGIWMEGDTEILEYWK